MVNLNDIRDSHDVEPVVIVMGQTTCGKSSFIKQLVGEDAVKVPKVGKGFTSYTQNTESYEVQLNHTKVHVIDTPGLSDTERPDSVILDDILCFYITMHELGFRLKGIIYLIDITAAFNGPAVHHLDWLEQFCGQPAYGNIVFATTKWSEEWSDKNRQDKVDNHRVLHDTKFLGRFMKKGAECHEYNEQSAKALSILKSLVAKDDVDFLIFHRVEDLLADTSAEAWKAMVAGTSNVDSIDPEIAAMRRKIHNQIELLETIKDKAVEEVTGGKHYKFTKEELRELAKKILNYFLENGIQIIGIAFNIASLIIA